MATYSISDLEKLSGIRTHTLRMWEQRYGVLRPQRTATNIRSYQDDDLQLLLNIALLNRHGVKISKIAALSRQEIAEKAGEVSEVRMGLDAELDLLTLAVVEMDEHKFARIFDHHAGQIGFERTMLEVVLPFLEKLSLLWLTGSVKPVQENFISQLIRNRIIQAIEKEPLATDRKAPKFLLYLPRGEQQELSLLFMQHLLRARKFRVVNMGWDTALLDVKDAVHIHQPDFVFTILSETFTQEPVRGYLEKLSQAAPGSRLLLAGYLAAVQLADLPASVVPLHGLEETIEFLEKLKTSPPHF